ncbi:hypothetical protein RND81_07G072500 [Saponaria officinalis]|uniref:DUF4371 domain-containing protein n=1 Tax=Saponaria officinalis TaxID=3572 RepID=A0AAW1JPX3_SAPOF
MPSPSEECHLDRPHDSGKRKTILSYSVNDRDFVRRICIGKGPCRPRPNGDFPQTLEGTKLCRFKAIWYDKYDWFEYSEQNESAFCFYCYLFKDPISVPGGNVFELIKCCAQETTKLIIEDLNGDLFVILADESSDVSHKEELAICLHYVDKKGRVCERFLEIVHVKKTSSLTIFEGIKQLLDAHSLSMSNIRGQGYDGASNMGGELNGLRNLILRNNSCAYYVHYFAHQLPLTLMAVTKENKDCAKYFQNLGIVLYNIGYSCKHMEMVKDIQADNVLEALALERGLSRPGYTRWGSYFKLILSVMSLYDIIIKVLEVVSKDAKSVDDRAKAEIEIDHLESFEFVFMLHLMKVVYGYTNNLCDALQRKDQDIVNAIAITDLTKEHLNKLAKFNPNGFSDTDITTLEFELYIFVSDMIKDSRFHLVKNLGELSTMLVETKKHIVYW